MSSSKIDLTAFEQLVKYHHTMIFRTVMGFLHHKEDAEDVVQEVFIRAYRGWERFRGDAEASTWLYRIAVNLSLNHISQRNRKGFLQAGEDALKKLFNHDSGECNAQQAMEIVERDRAVQKAIDTLSGKQRTAFVLSKYDDLPQKEIAVIMQISEGAVEQLLQRAKANLQKKLKRTIGKHD